MKFFPQVFFRTPIYSKYTSTNPPNFLELIYLSSLSLASEFQKNKHINILQTGDFEKVSISLYKYLTRATTRCTPFGLFAGIGCAEWSHKSSILFDTNLENVIKRKTRFDTNVLCALTQKLATLPFIEPYLIYYPNNSIYKIAEYYRYVEYYYVKSNRVHNLSKVDFSEYLELIFNKSKHGVSKKKLISLLMDNGIDVEEAIYFINELINVQLLKNQLEPTLTGLDYFSIILLELKKIQEIQRSKDLDVLVNSLLQIEKQLIELDKNLFNNTSEYKKIHENLKTILPEVSEVNLFQTDLFKKSIQSTLDQELQVKLKEAIILLDKITPKYQNHNLTEFKKRFVDYYEDSEVPLLIALDSEAGIGYPNKNNDGINELAQTVYAQSISNENKIKWNHQQSCLLRLIFKALIQNKKVVEISELDFEGVDFSKDSVLPTTMSIIFNVIDNHTNKIKLSSFGGSSAINILGRFAIGDDRINETLIDLANFEQEQCGSKILAEIIHLPESRTGNVLARTIFRKYEIPYLAKSAVETNYQIRVEDLYIKIQDDKIVLFDKRLKKEIIPRLGNAHNYSFNSLPVYHFLCDMQTQYFNKPYLGFNWGVLANQFSFLPRVEYNNIILSSARWLLKKKDLEPLQNKKANSKQKLECFQMLKDKMELPDLFLIVEGDNELLIDCHNSMALATFIDLVKNKNEVTLHEFLFENKNALVKDTEGNPFLNECIAILLNDNKNSFSQKPLNIRNLTTQHNFILGSEWLYYKIYCGVKTADYIISEKFNLIIEGLLKSGLITKWFFIRYADPQFHLRLRLKLIDKSKIGEVINILFEQFQPLLDDKLINKVTTDNYKREIERYGETTIEHVESLFSYDSIFNIRMLNLLDTETGNTIRWQIAIRSVDEFLNDFKFNLIEKFNIIERLNKSFFEEHGGQKELRLFLDEKYRKNRPKINEILNIKIDNEKEYLPIINALKQRSENSKFHIGQIIEMDRNNFLHVNLTSLIGSILHMNLNRLFMGRNRTNEFIVYDHLFRHYKSELAKNKNC
ncbi:MAG: lantibiotic dehydratase [Bacteroidota bacterium]